MATEYRKLPFDEAIRFFRQKIRLPTRAWTDLWEGMHARAFVVAGAMRDDLLSDLYAAVDKAIAEGTTLAAFRKDFDALVNRHGWTYKGGRGWRTRVIYETNVRQAYNAGREAQFRDPDFRKRMPYLLYRHGDSAHPRPLHLSWDGLVLPHDDPWWDTHTPMNGWGCKCKKFGLSQSQLERMGKTGPDTAPDDGHYEWQSRDGRRSQRIPNGIDPGFAYNVGQAAWGKIVSQEIMDAWRASSEAAWEPLTHGGPATFDRPENIPLEKPKARLGHRAKSRTEVAAILRGILGSEEQVFDVLGRPVLVNAERLAEHVKLDRSEFLPYITEALQDPYEVWLTFERHRATGRVALRMRVIKGIDVGKGKGIVIVFNAIRGVLEAWTFIAITRARGINKKRRGDLLFGRE